MVNRLKIMLYKGFFCWTGAIVRRIISHGMKFGSSFRRVTGVSSLNLARRPMGWRASFVMGGI
jgi:hypothetical protein